MTNVPIGASTPKRKAIVYIDGANMFYAQKKVGWTIDWKKAQTHLSKQWDVVEYRYYTGLKDNDEKMDEI